MSQPQRVLGQRNYEQIESFFDNYGVLTQADGDAGDPNNTFLYFIFAYLQNENTMARGQLRAKVQTLIDSLQVAPGVWIRHPNDGTDWHKDPGRFSRDQWTSLVIMLALYGFKTELQNTYKNQLAAKGKYQNADWAIPTSNFWGLYWRCLEVKTKWLYLADLWLLGGVVIHCYKTAKDYDDVGDDKNQVAQLIAQELWQPTWISKLAMWYYKIHRKVFMIEFNLGTILLNPAQYAFDWYYRKTPRAVNEPYPPPIAKFAEPTLSKYFSK